MSEGSASPVFSIIVATHARPRELRRCLEAIAASHYPRDRLEVIVVDDGGEEPLDALIAAHQATMAVRLHRQANAGPAAARNAGARLATGRYLAFTDDDCTPDPSWLSCLEKRFEHASDRMVGGRTINALDTDFYAETNQLIVDMVYNHFNADPDDAAFFSSDNMAVSTEAFRRIGGFDEHLRISEDRELCARWRSLGHRMTFAPDAVVYHRHPMTFLGFVRRHFGRGRGAYRYHGIAMEHGNARLREESSFHLDVRNLLCYPLSRVELHRRLPLLVLLLIWQVANTTGFFWEALRSRLAGSRREGGRVV